jgi:hypothetical protein
LACHGGVVDLPLLGTKIEKLIFFCALSIKK